LYVAKSNYDHYYKLASDAATVNATGYTLTGSNIAESISLVETFPYTSNLVLSNLTASSGVYTNTLKGLTSTPPTTGLLGWVTRGSGVIYPSVLTDNFGLGTATPVAKLDVVSPAGTVPFSFWQQQAATNIPTLIQMQVGAASADTIGYLSCSGANKDIELQGVYGARLSAGAGSSRLLGVQVLTSGFIGLGLSTPLARVHIQETTTTTNAVKEVLRIEAVVSTGATGGANGFGVGQSFYGETATDGTNQIMAQIAAIYTDSTNATRKSKLQFSAYDTAQRIGIDIYADGTQSMVAIGGATAGARLTLPAGGTAATTSPLRFTTQAAGLTNVEQGSMELIGNSLQFTQLAKRRGVVMSQAVKTTDFQLISSSAESATIITAEHGANYLEAGKMEEIRLYGTLQKDVGTPTNALTIRTKYAGATIHTIVSSNAAISANTVIEIIIVITCRTTGATGTVQINSIVRIDGDIITPAAPTLATVDTTMAQNTTVTAQFTNSSATNNLVINQGRVLCIENNK
jgi:hypothetical protein